MQIQAVLFDLDGTLLPMDQEIFIKAYFGGLCGRLAPYGYDPKKLVAAIWQGTAAMVKNDGKCTNEDVFWNAFAQIFGENVRQDEPKFEAFYREDFADRVRESCGFDSRARQVIDLVKQKGWKTILATNPIFPSIATEIRMRHAGLSPDDFELYTTYENSRYCKPNPMYYKEILTQCKLDPAACVMVGNDVDEDMIAQSLGMRTFLLTDCLINKSQTDINLYPHGGFDDLLAFLEALA